MNLDMNPNVFIILREFGSSEIVPAHIVAPCREGAYVATEGGEVWRTYPEMYATQSEAFAVVRETFPVGTRVAWFLRNENDDVLIGTVVELAIEQDDTVGVEIDMVVMRTDWYGTTASVSGTKVYRAKVTDLGLY